MEKKRLFHQIRLLLIPGSKKRVEYLKRHHVFHECGENVYIQSRKIPLYANLISFHNNIRIASNVSFLTHDVIHTVLNNTFNNQGEYQEYLGCIEIMDNVFIGANSSILYGTRIGPNAIVAAGSVVTKDVPPGCIVGGVPAKVIGTFDSLVENRKGYIYPHELRTQHQQVSRQLEMLMWEKFRNND